MTSFNIKLVPQPKDLPEVWCMINRCLTYGEDCTGPTATFIHDNGMMNYYTDMLDTYYNPGGVMCQPLTYESWPTRAFDHMSDLKYIVLYIDTTCVEEEENLWSLDGLKRYQISPVDTEYLITSLDIRDLIFDTFGVSLDDEVVITRPFRDGATGSGGDGIRVLIRNKKSKMV